MTTRREFTPAIAQLFGGFGVPANGTRVAGLAPEVSMGIGSFVLTRGIVSVIIGIIAFVWPGVTISTLVGLFALYALIDGVMNLYLGFSRRLGRNPAWGQLLQGALGILAGIVTFLWPAVTAQLLIFFIGTWAVLNGILQIVAAVRLRKIIRGEWLLAAGGAMSIVFGLVVIARPGVAMVGLSWSLGVYALVSGLVLIALGLRLRDVSARMALAARA